MSRFIAFLFYNQKLITRKASFFVKSHINMKLVHSLWLEELHLHFTITKIHNYQHYEIGLNSLIVLITISRRH